MKQIKEDMTSIVVSICLHALLLLCLYWLVATTIQHQTLSLTATTSPTAESQAFLSLPPADKYEIESEPETRTELEVMQSAELLASINSKDFLVSSKGKAVEFFGSQAYGNKFVFILDISTSMSARREERFERAKAEMIRSISELSPQQRYYVYLFCWQTCRMYGYANRFGHIAPPPDENPQFVTANADNLKKLQDWLYKVNLSGGTDPRRALSLANAMKPDAVFLLSDGEFNQPSSKLPNTGWIDEQDIPAKASVAQGVEIALSDVPIHTIAYENPFTRETMKKIAEVTGGSTRYIKTRSHEPIKPASFVNGLQAVRQKKMHFPRNLEPQHGARLKYARTLIEDGEFAFAEYLVRPARDYAFETPANRKLAKQIFAFLNEELRDTRLEDFPNVPMEQIMKLVEIGRPIRRF